VLEKLGLAQYAQRFDENGIDFSVLRDPMDQDLKGIGVCLGHRRKMLRAIGKLSAPATPQPAAAILPRRWDSAERSRRAEMFCDLVVGSTEMSNQLDPKDLREIDGELLKLAIEVSQTTAGGSRRGAPKLPPRLGRRA